MTDYRKQLEAVIEIISFDSRPGFSWFGRRSPHFPAKVLKTASPQIVRQYLLFVLESQLYRDFYCPGEPTPVYVDPFDDHPGEMQPHVQSLIAELSGANCGHGYNVDGWQVVGLEDGATVVRKAGLDLRVPPGEACTINGFTNVVGARVVLHFPKEFMGVSPGFYMAVGDRDLSQTDSMTVMRVYWNIATTHAVRLIKDLTWALNKEQLPFRLKVLNDPDTFTRCDSAVLYFSKHHWAAIGDIVREVYVKVAPGLRKGIPAFTKRIAPGVAICEDPGKDLSFGMHRCHLLADGLLTANEFGRKSTDKRLESVAERFREEGIFLERPFLNRGSPDWDGYDLDVPDLSRRLIKNGSSSIGRSSRSTLLRVAKTIGHLLANKAIWHGGRCTWLGVVPGQAHGRRIAVKYRTLGSDLYWGNAGVALFFAELYTATGDIGFRRIALGAIRQSIAYVKEIPDRDSLGLYCGWPGVALAIAWIGMLFEEEELFSQAAQLVQQLMSSARHTGEYDLMFGSAGAVTVFIALNEFLKEQAFLDFAVLLGNELLRNAHISHVGYSWPARGPRNNYNLTGFSHGTSGIGYSLLELYQVTGDKKYRYAAEQAFEYERYWFDPEAGNWPDFRFIGSRTKHKRSHWPFCAYWCHGAPGIGLSRLRAYEILKDDNYKAEAKTALRATSVMIENALQSQIAEFCLCHGLTGNAEVLKYASEVLGQEVSGGTDLLLAVADAGNARYRAGRLSRGFSTTGSGDENPSLMVGLAGVGLFYLRLYDPAVPSILLLRKESIRARKIKKG